MSFHGLRARHLVVGNRHIGAMLMNPAGTATAPVSAHVAAVTRLGFRWRSAASDEFLNLPVELECAARSRPLSSRHHLPAQPTPRNDPVHPSAGLRSNSSPPRTTESSLASLTTRYIAHHYGAVGERSPTYSPASGSSVSARAGREASGSRSRGAASQLRLVQLRVDGVEHTLAFLVWTLVVTHHLAAELLVAFSKQLLDVGTLRLS